MQEYEASGNGGNTMMAFGLGMLAGAVTALLLAPANGQETRRRIGQFTSKVGEKTRDGLGVAKDFVSDQKDRLANAVDEGRQAYVRETGAATGSAYSASPGTSGRPSGTSGKM
jgi:gas vesicle protein